jgi:hypothetical protein
MCADRVRDSVPRNSTALIVYWSPANHWWWGYHRFIWAMQEFYGRVHQ